MEVLKPNLSHAPWTEDEVHSLNGWQLDGKAHPYTCRCSKSLIATKEGWRCLDCPDYRQDWALKWLTNWEWKKVFDCFPAEAQQMLCDEPSCQPPTTG